MAVIGAYIKGVWMINVVLIDNNPASMLSASLSQQNDMSVANVLPTTMENIVEQIGDKKPDIIIISESTEKNNKNLLCHFLAKNYHYARHLVLTDTAPTYEMLENSGFRARGFITPDQHSIITKAIRVVFDGQAWLPRKLVTEILNRYVTTF